MKDKLFNIIRQHFPEDYFSINERREKVGATVFFEIKDRDTEGKNISAMFFVYENEPDTVSLEINNVMSTAKIENVEAEILKVLDNAIELRERFLKISENRNRLIELEKQRQGSMEEKISDKKEGKENGDDNPPLDTDENSLHNKFRQETDGEYNQGNRTSIQDDSDRGTGQGQP